MLINKDIPVDDKIILNKLGKDADTPLRDLFSCTKYKSESSLYNRIRILRNKKYLFGPYFDINYNAIGRNKLFSVLVLAEYDLRHKEAVLDAMRKIDCWTMIYPVRTAEAYLGIYRCNNWNYIARLFNLMKRWGWLRDYSVHKSEYQWIRKNPNFFGDFLPSHNNQIPQEELPPYQYEDLETDCEFTEVDLAILKHLSMKTIHLTEIRDLEYQYLGLKRKYHDLKRSYERLRQTGVLVKKFFSLFPLPADMCTLFFLFSRGKNFTSHLNMMAHFGAESRLAKILIITSTTMISYFMAHPLLEGKILGIIEDNVNYVNIYGIRTYPSTEFSTQTFNDNYFDLNSQRWIFPFTKFEEELKKLKEKRDLI